MSYIDGFLVPVPIDKKQAYIDQAEQSLSLFKEFGATRMVETWDDDVHIGTLTDFRMAVKAEEGEAVVFSWMEYPDKATRDAAGEKIMSDPRMKEMGANMPFDGKRMIYAGFEPILESGPGGDMGYADGFVAPVKLENKQAYLDWAIKAAPIFQEHGATRIVETWGEGLPDGKVTDFKMAVKAEPGEAIVFSFIEWPSKATRDAGWAKAMEDPRMQPDGKDMPFDGKRMIYGGFSPVVDG
jgi:uncharacterized protein YbaA (DUF1428 family)